jgi:hypothetical protein
MAARIGVDDGRGESREVVKKGMPGRLGDGVAIGDGQVLVDGDLDLRSQTVPDPPHSQLADSLDTRDFL